MLRNSEPTPRGRCSIGGFTRELMKEWKTPGLSVVVIRGGKEIYSRGFGVEAVGSRKRVSSATCFPADSLTKTFTAVLAAMLVEDGRLHWDTEVRSVIPEFRLRDPLASQACTIKDLLSHRSGIGRRDALWYRRELGAGKTLALLPLLRADSPFRDRFAYSNIGFMLAGMMEAKLSGMSFAELLSRRILQPLRMPSTGVKAPTGGETAQPHILGSGRSAERISPLRAPAMEAAFGIWSSADDLGKYLRFLLEPKHRNLISGENLERLWTPVLPVQDLSFPEIPMKAYGMGWMISSYRGRRIVFHTGVGIGSSSLLLLIPGEDIGLAVLSNVGGSRAPEILAWRVADLLMGLEPVDWKSRLWVQEEKLRELEIRQEKSLEIPQQETIPFPENIIGSWENPAYGKLEIHRNPDGGKLLYFRHVSLPLKAIRNGAFLTIGGQDPVLRNIILEISGKGETQEIFLHLDGQRLHFTRN